MGIRCSDCSRLFDGVGELDGHDCDGDNVTVLVVHPESAKAQEENPARVFEDRDEAEDVAASIDTPTRMIDAPLIESGDDGTVTIDRELAEKLADNHKAVAQRAYSGNSTTAGDIHHSWARQLAEAADADWQELGDG